jgi:DNA-binding MarR family transcriptional regulator
VAIGADDRVASDRLENTLAALVVAINDKLLEGLANSSDLGPSDTAALVVLSRVPQRIEAVSRQLGLSHSATVRLVDRLDAAGLARRRPGRDARSVSVALTARGVRSARRLLAEREHILSVALADLTVTERAALAGVVERLLVRLARDWTTAMQICRLCDIPGCEADGACPVALGAEERTHVSAEELRQRRGRGAIS